MKKINSTNTAESVHCYKTTPEELREIANRLDAQAPLPGQVIFYNAGANTVFYFDPEIPTSTFPEKQRVLQIGPGPDLVA